MSYTFLTLVCLHTAQLPLILLRCLLYGWEQHGLCKMVQNDVSTARTLVQISTVVQLQQIEQPVVSIYKCKSKAQVPAC